jgi:predicted nucleic acid-binding Zn ribbon protein
MARRGYARLLSHADFGDAWMKVSGTLSQHSRPGRMRRGKLEIIVTNSAAMQELSFGKRRLLAGMQEALPEQTITDLRFSVRND